MFSPLFFSGLEYSENTFVCFLASILVIFLVSEARLFQVPLLRSYRYCRQLDILYRLENVKTVGYPFSTCLEALAWKLRAQGGASLQPCVCARARCLPQAALCGMDCLF